ncbi:hypothetical protein RYX36_010091 [Vicia faba]
MNERCKTHLFASEVAIHTALLKSDVRTFDPYEADFFFALVYVSCNFSTVNADAIVVNSSSIVNESAQEPGPETVTETGTEPAVTPPEKRWTGWPGDCVFRLIVPVGKVGSIIGRKGELIKKLCEETKARVRVLDADLGTLDRVILISGKEELEAAISPAMDAAVRIFKRVSGLSEIDSEIKGSAGVTVCSIRLLVPSTQAISLIGKQWSLIKSIQESSGASVRVLSVDEVQYFATAEERIVDLQGEALKVFIYELPTKYNKDWLMNERCKTHLFASEVAIHTALLKSDVRTFDPYEADFFFAPVYVSCNFSTVNADAIVVNSSSIVNESAQEPGPETVTETGTEPDVTPPEKRWSGWPGDCVFRLIVPVGKVGSIIGRKGELIKKLCEETKARVRVLDADLGTLDRVILISGKEELEAAISPAMDAAVRIFKRVSGLSEIDSEIKGSAGVTVCSIRLLVPSTQAISLIGKQGSLIKSIQESSGASVRVLSVDEVQYFATAEERIVDLQGEALKDARSGFCNEQYEAWHLVVRMDMEMDSYGMA